jgi:hypothetical protein
MYIYVLLTFLQDRIARLAFCKASVHVIALLALPFKATRKIAKMVFTLIAKISAVYLHESISIIYF